MILEKRDMSDLSNIILSAAIRLLVFVYYWKTVTDLLISLLIIFL